jgi:hypothetical protein
MLVLPWKGNLTPIFVFASGKATEKRILESLPRTQDLGGNSLVRGDDINRCSNGDSVTKRTRKEIVALDFGISGVGVMRND